MSKPGEARAHISRSFVNSFHYLYQDAESFHQLAQLPEVTESFGCVRFCRTAILLYVFSLEALINRAMDHFNPQQLHDFFVDREEKLSVEDKWFLLPLLSTKESHSFDKSRYPWSHFAEIVRMRNDFVHPKHDRAAYYQVITAANWQPLSWKHIPQGLGVKESDLVYRNTKIPKDPYAIRLDHVDTVKKIVDDVTKELDRLLDGQIFQDNWLRKDEMKLVYPPGATYADLPPDPK